MISSPELSECVPDLHRQFGMGSRSCVGRNLATVEMFKFTAQFCRHFEAKLVNEQKPWTTKTQWFALQNDFWVTVRRRERETNMKTASGEAGPRQMGSDLTDE